jgi:GNAT superfamily N-acetyltransferase
VDDDASGAHMASALGGTWTAECEVLMVLPGAPAPIAGAGAVVGVGEVDMLRLMRRWHRDEHPGIGAEALAQLDEYHRREGRVTGERCFGAACADGRSASLAKLRGGGDSMWVDDVYTAPEARRRGLARRVVTDVCARARAEGAALVFLVADAQDWPQHLYAEIGFRPVGRRWLLHRDAP